MGSIAALRDSLLRPVDVK
jgi:hypothetical protein